MLRNEGSLVSVYFLSFNFSGNTTYDGRWEDRFVFWRANILVQLGTDTRPVLSLHLLSCSRHRSKPTHRFWGIYNWSCLFSFRGFNYCFGEDELDCLFYKVIFFLPRMRRSRLDGALLRKCQLGALFYKFYQIYVPVRHSLRFLVCKLQTGHCHPFGLEQGCKFRTLIIQPVQNDHLVKLGIRPASYAKRSYIFSIDFN